MRRAPRAAILALGWAAGLAAAPVKPLGPELESEVRWTTGGLRPARTYQQQMPREDPDWSKYLGRRIPTHMDPLDLECREAFGAGVIEIAESLKEAITRNGVGIREAFQGGPYEVTGILVRSRAPNFFPHDYGVGFRLRVTVRGLYKSTEGWHEPLDFPLDLNLLAGREGFVRADLRVDWDASPGAAGGAPEPIREHLLRSAKHVAAAFGPRQLQGMEARIRDLARATLRMEPQDRPRTNPVFDEAYIPMALEEARLKIDLRDAGGMPGPDGKPDRMTVDGRLEDRPLRVVNRLRKIRRGPVTRGGEPRVDFQGYAGWDVYLGEQKILSGIDGRTKFCLVGDTDGDWVPDMVLLEEKASAGSLHDPYHPVHTAMLRPAIYFLDGQDLVRGVYDMGPVRYDFPPGEEGKEIRRIQLVSRTVEGEARDWDVAVEVFDPHGRVIEPTMIFDRYPSNRKRPQEVGYQRAEFRGPRGVRRTRSLRFRVNFPLDRHHLTDEARKQLEELMQEVGEHHYVARGRLVGHTCDLNDFDYNEALGMRRARAVRAWLADHGVRPSVLELETRGEEDPVRSNTTDKGKQENRRVDGWLLLKPRARPRPPWYGKVGALGPRGPGGTPPGW